MDTLEGHGKTSNSWSEKRTNQLDDNARISAKVETDSRSFEHQSRRTTGEVDKSMGQTGIRWIIGGILGLFREVIDEALSYMDEHGERLEKRLIDHKNKKASFLEKSAALEKEISRLLEQVEKLPEESTTEEE
ncbi:MAG: hypothetical protein F6K23_07985 [Okeania sp. SIO2C9]|uniref:hypothetical protein n=1 Tax=Okeania sp. SIO2C9 TaxID=2607791 RepID=UPI0013C180B7|nr:hypothetical protein [Okeania sp. SIO2C9]NEQ73019.1 hypothetical protein [Okeania sp. SIO2C9]